MREHVIKTKDGTDINVIVSDMLFFIVEDALDGMNKRLCIKGIRRIVAILAETIMVPPRINSALWKSFFYTQHMPIPSSCCSGEGGVGKGRYGGN